MALFDIKFSPFRDDRRSGRAYPNGRKGSCLLKLILMMSQHPLLGNMETLLLLATPMVLSMPVTPA